MADDKASLAREQRRLGGLLVRPCRLHFLRLPGALVDGLAPNIPVMLAQTIAKYGAVFHQWGYP